MIRRQQLTIRSHWMYRLFCIIDILLGEIEMCDPILIVTRFEAIPLNSLFWVLSKHRCYPKAIRWKRNDEVIAKEEQRA